MELEMLLAHGRGRGRLGALARGSAARDLVLEQVIEDPRWDSQVESRDEYYATILLAIGCSTEPLVEALTRSDPDDPGLPLAVLIQMAWRQHVGALAALVDRLRGGDEELLDHFKSLAGSGRATELAALAGRTFVPNPAWDRVGPTDELPTQVAALVELVRAPNDDPRKVAAGRQLGELEHFELLGEAEAFLRGQCGLEPGQRGTASRQRRAWVVYLAALPGAHTLERARAWLPEPWPLSSTAWDILSRHAEPEDHPMLETAGYAALADQDVYRLCHVLDALAHLAAPESIPLLTEAYCTTNYSYARERACAGLLAHRERPDVQALLVESLWDCESTTRAYACEAARRADASARLRELAGDAYESDEVREAARVALALR